MCMTVNPVSAIQLFGSSALAKSMKVTERSSERSQRTHWEVNCEVTGKGHDSTMIPMFQHHFLDLSEESTS